MNSLISHIESAFILAETAKKSNAQKFVRLVKKVSQQLATENENLGRLTIKGRLVEVPPAGEAVVVGDLHGDLDSLVHILDESKFLAKVGAKNDV